MSYKIKNLDEINFLEKNLWGNKALYLSCLKKKNVNVADGFCISITSDYYDLDDYDFCNAIEDYFDNLRQRTQSKNYIVRSSALCEDKKEHVFPGIFNSCLNVCSIHDLLLAVKSCFNSFTTDYANDYVKEMGITQNTKSNFCIIVQEQIKLDYSGVLFTQVPLHGYYNSESMYVEMIQGHCQEMLHGNEIGNTYFLSRNNGLYEIRPAFESVTIHIDVARSVLSLLIEEISKIGILWEQNWDIEWGSCNDRIYILQMRRVKNVSNNSKISESSSVNVGMKAEAMQKFHDLGLFNKDLLIIRPGKSINQIIRSIESMPAFHGPVTIRYSCATEIGLPRFFSNSLEETISFVKNTYNSKWAIIIHESINVRHSYEVYMNDILTRVEHMPGMWESDCKEPVDVIIYKKDIIHAYLANCIRRVRYEDSIFEISCEEPPYKEKEMHNIAKRLMPYLEIVRNHWNTNEGINFHFVEDEFNNVFFLNHRKASMDIQETDKSSNVLVLTDYSDLKNWNGEDILIKINIKRGEESLLKNLVPFLKNKKIKVYVEFGLLSHPAIMLREMGVDVYPEYSRLTECVWEY